jgi:molybdopterin/thiamine biosynthesis adenylyltransferase
VFFANVKHSGFVHQGDAPNIIKARYSRNIQALSSEETAVLHTKRVCVIGCGGLGGYVIETLARMGIGHITAVDYDVFEKSNLNRQLLSTEKQIGVSKAEAAVMRISEVNSQVSINALNVKFDESNGEQILAGHDIVIDALDNIKTRLILAEICQKLAIPLVHGSIAGWYGQVTSIFPGDTTMAKIYQNVKADKGIEADLGNLPFCASLVASLQCAECIKILTGRGEVLKGKMLRIDLRDNEFIEILLGE